MHICIYVTMTEDRRKENVLVIYWLMPARNARWRQNNAYLEIYVRRLLFVLASSKFNETHFQRYLTTCQAQMVQGRIIYQREGFIKQRLKRPFVSAISCAKKLSRFMISLIVCLQQQQSLSIHPTWNAKTKCCKSEITSDEYNNR